MSKFGHVTQATPTIGVVMWSGRSRGPSSMSAKSEVDGSIRSKVIGGPNISKLGHVTQATPTSGSFYDLDAVGVRPLCLCQI